MSEAVFYRWSDLPTDRPLEKLSRRRIIGEQVMISEVSLEKGCLVGTHAHTNEQITMVVSGKLRLRVGAEGSKCVDHVLGPGEALVLPSMVPHAAEALEDTRVVDVFSPVSEGTGIDRLGAEG
jgi:quercetin dioxygenase-like cupin family protein